MPSTCTGECNRLCLPYGSTAALHVVHRHHRASQATTCEPQGQGTAADAVAGQQQRLTSKSNDACTALLSIDEGSTALGNMVQAPRTADLHAVHAARCQHTHDDVWQRSISVDRFHAHALKRWVENDDACFSHRLSWLLLYG